MRVLMFGWEFPPHNSGGLGVACWGLARALVQEGTEVTFVLPRRINAALPGVRFVFADRGAPIITESTVTTALYSGYATETSVSNALRSISPSPVMPAWGLMNEVLRYALLARIVAHEETFDVIHAHDWLSFLAGVEAKRVSGKPLVVHVHATEFDRTGNGAVNDAVYAIEKRGMEVADRIIAVSEFTKNVIAQRYGISRDKIEVVHNGIDPDDPVVTADSIERIEKLKQAGNKIVLFVGRLTLQKGPDYFLRAARRALEFDRNLLFVVSGSGDMEQALMQEAAFLGIADRMFFVGFLRGAELGAMYRIADVFVMPSVSEPFGIVPLEALLNGTPVLISKQSGVSEVLQHALKVDFWDTEAMAERIIACTRHQSLARTLIENGGREAGTARWKRAAEKCMLIYTHAAHS
jgi:glycosyltransferase involved in cell wall biosynthesis